MTSKRSGSRILVLASDPLLAALVGHLVEAAHLRAVFPDDEERPESALARVRPVAAILVDAMTDGAESDLFLTRARRGGVEVLVFGSRVSIERRLGWATEREVPLFALPDELEKLRAALERIGQPTAPARKERQGQRRSPRATRAPDGVLSFDDAAGVTWTVYDRRSADRRQDGVDRRFVSQTGEVRRCDLTATEARATSPAELVRQLARARAES